jgi:hypothetical protein
MVEKKSERRAAGKSRRDKVKASNKLYTMCVYLIDDPVAGKHCGQTISRTVQIRVDQTLEDLHKIIFKAFRREDEHLYEFNLGEGPDDRCAIYSLRSDNSGADIRSRGRRRCYDHYYRFIEPGSRTSFWMAMMF